MIVCERCGGNCDPGEIVQGICLECMEEQRMEIVRSSKITRLMSAPFYQMTLEDIIHGI